MTATVPARSPATGQPAAFDEALPRIRAVLAELAGGASERDRSGEHPYALVRDLADAGFGRLRVPREYGGFDVDLPTLFELLAEAGQADSNVPQIWRGHFTTTEILRAETDPDVRDHWLTAIGQGAVFGNAQSEPSALVAAAVAAAAGTAPAWGATTTRVRLGRGRRPRWSRAPSSIRPAPRFADYIRAAVVDEDGRPRFRGDPRPAPRRHPRRRLGRHRPAPDRQRNDDLRPTCRSEPHGDIGRYQESLRGLDSFVQIVHLANLTGIARSIVAETVTSSARGPAPACTR